MPKGRSLGTVAGVVVQRALRLTADDIDVLAMAQEWSQQESRPDMFAIPALATDRVGTVAAIADLGIPVYRETELLLDRSPYNLNWVSTALLAPAGRFRYVSVVPAISFLGELVPACTRAGVPLDSIVVRAHTDVEHAAEKAVKSFATHMSDLGLTQLRTDTVMLERFGDLLAMFDTWLDDRTEAEHHRTLDATTSAAVVILDPTSSHWSD